MSKSYQDKVVWITGGGSGIGRALVLEFVQQGAAVAVSGRRVDRLDAVVQEVTDRGGQALAVSCDVTDEASVEQAVATVAQHFGRLDVAVANAGFAVTGAIETLSAEDWRRQLDVNVVGAAITARHALPLLRKHSGRMVLISSVAGHISAPRSGAYCASKYAVRAIGQALAAELHGSGVSCTTIYPGYVESEIAQVDNDGVYHPERADKRPQRFMWSVDRAARVMVAAITRRQRDFVFTWHGKFGAWIGRHAPWFAHFVLTRGRK